jgi:hypothetical protein
MVVSILKWVGIVVLVIVLALALFLFSMRFADGPRGIISGGPFKTGEPAATPDSWSRLKDRDTIEFQTMEPARSRTVWLATHDSRLFIVSGYMNTIYGAVWKHWPHYMDADNRVVLRIDGKLYDQVLERITGGPDVVPVLQEFQRKYGLGGAATEATVTSGDVWLYEVRPRS